MYCFIIICLGKYISDAGVKVQGINYYFNFLWTQNII